MKGCEAVPPTAIREGMKERSVGVCVEGWGASSSTTALIVVHFWQDVGPAAEGARCSSPAQCLQSIYCYYNNQRCSSPAHCLQLETESSRQAARSR